MTMPGLAELFRRILRGYRSAAIRVAWIAGFLGLAVAISAAIVYPLWLLAGSYPETFTLGVLALLALLLLVWAAGRLRGALEREGSAAALFRTVILPGLARVGAAVLLVISAYVIAVAYAQEVFAVAVPGTVLFGAALGYLLYLRGRSPRHEAR